MDNEAGWQRLAQAVRDRRADRNWTQLDVATRGSISIDRIQAIESARTDRYSARTLSKLERALEWELGSVRAILGGGKPTTLEKTRVPDSERSPVELQRELAERIERIMAVPDRRDMLDKFTQSIDPGAQAS